MLWTYHTCSGSPYLAGGQCPSLDLAAQGEQRHQEGNAAKYAVSSHSDRIFLNRGLKPFRMQYWSECATLAPCSRPYLRPGDASGCEANADGARSNPTWRDGPGACHVRGSASIGAAVENLRGAKSWAYTGIMSQDLAVQWSLLSFSAPDKAPCPWISSAQVIAPGDRTPKSVLQNTKDNLPPPNQSDQSY